MASEAQEGSACLDEVPMTESRNFTTDDLSAAREAWEKVRVRAFGNTEPCEEGSCRHVDCRLLLTGGNLFAVLEDTLAQRNEMLAKVREACDRAIRVYDHNGNLLVWLPVSRILAILDAGGER